MPTLEEIYAQKYAGVKPTNLTPQMSGKLTNKAVVEPTVKNPSPSAIQQIGQKIGSVSSQTLHMGESLAKITGKFVANSAVDIYQSGKLATQTYVDIKTLPMRQKAIADATRQLDSTQKSINEAYKSGKMSKENFAKANRDLSKSYSDISKENDKILQGPTPQQRAQAVVETAINVISLGSLGLAEVGGKQVIKAGSKKTIETLIDQGASTLEKQVLKSGAIRSLVMRNLEADAKIAASEGGWDLIKRNLTKVTTGLLIKRPVFYQSNIGQATSLYKNILEGDVKGGLSDFAWLGIQMVNGGPLGAAKELGNWAKTATSKLAKGKGSFIDELSANFGTKQRDQIARAIAEDPSIEKTWRIAETHNMRVAGGDVNTAVDNFMRTYDWMTPEDLSTITPKQLAEDFVRWQNSYESLDAAKKSLVKVGAMTQQEADRITVVRIDQKMRNAVSKAIKQTTNPEDAWAAVTGLSERPNVGFGSNNNFMLRLERIVKDPSQEFNAERIAKEIREINAAQTISTSIPRKIAKEIGQNGFTIAMADTAINKLPDFEDTTKLISSAVNNPELFNPSVSPNPTLSYIAGLFERGGISPQEANLSANRKLGESITSSLLGTEAAQEIGLKLRKKARKKDGGDLTNGGQALLASLQKFIEDKPGVRGFDRISAGESALTDIRQLTINEIQQATKSKGGVLISVDAAKEIRRAILEGYQKVPLEFRGLGEKVTDTLYSINPLQKHYSRIQGALRYTYNPFFRVQESAETKVLTHVQTSNLIWRQTKTELDDSVKILERANMFKGQLPGEASGQNIYGRITANLTPGQKRDLAGLAEDIAQKQGKTLQQLANENPEIIDDAIRTTVQYGRKGTLSSPLARTLNLVFFPVRYNMKVTKIAVDVLAKQPPSIQKAVLHSLFQMDDWLKSDEGIQWQNKNSDAISLFSWLTPVNSIQATMSLLNGVQSPGDLGQLGGLPLGIITQILDGQGIISLNKPYVNPKTGDVLPKYIPQTTKARAATALADLLNTMFTYPGRILGLPGKSQAIRDAVGAVIKTSPSEIQKIDESSNLTPLQKNWVRVLKNKDTSDEAIDALYKSPAPGQWQGGYTLPPLAAPYRIRPLTQQPEKPTKRTGLPSKAKGKKTKKLAVPISGN